MAEQLTIGGKEYVSSKTAAVTTGYAQDYIGQLARAGLIDAQRVGGLWYVNVDSLRGYKEKSESCKPQQPIAQPAPELESIVSFDGKDYISASRASKITGYNQDYIGQLARSGKILSRQIGNRWYVERAGLLAHKKEKDGLLAAVQAESVGLKRDIAPAVQNSLTGAYAGAGPVLRYFADDRDLMPVLRERNDVAAENTSPRAEEIETPEPEKAPNQIAIRKISTPAPVIHALPMMQKPVLPQKRAQKSPISASTAVAALTIVIVLSYGLVSMKEKSLYTFNFAPKNGVVNTTALSAGVASAFDAIGERLEALVTKGLEYQRSQ